MKLSMKYRNILRQNQRDSELLEELRQLNMANLAKSTPL
jgi:hypothetical protein